jgi:hypothetical protein
LKRKTEAGDEVDPEVALMEMFCEREREGVLREVGGVAAGSWRARTRRTIETGMQATTGT